MRTECVLTNLDKVLWPATGFTKGDMLDYYRAVAPAILPHLAGRPLTLRRFPDGVHALSWYQTECRGHPPWMPVLSITGPTGKPHEFCVVDDLPSLLWVVNLATIELHPFLGAAPAPERPSLMVLDLDPGHPAGLVQCCAVALRIRAILRELGLEAWPKSSGMRGLHLYIPVHPELSYADTKRFARELARRLVVERPSLVVDRASRAARRGRVFIDWSQNDRMKSTVAAYSLRAAPRPSVSTPLTWDEVETAAARGNVSALVPWPDELLRRLAGMGDVFSPVLANDVPRLRLSHVGALAS